MSKDVYKSLKRVSGLTVIQMSKTGGRFFDHNGKFNPLARRIQEVAFIFFCDGNFDPETKYPYKNYMLIPKTYLN